MPFQPTSTMGTTYLRFGEWGEDRDGIIVEDSQSSTNHPNMKVLTLGVGGRAWQ